MAKHHLLLVFVLLSIGASAFAADQSQPVRTTHKERLVLMPLKVSEDDKELQGAMENALVEGLTQKYEVFAGERVRKKMREVFTRESASAKHDCDATRCIQDIAIAFNAELVATANLIKNENNYIATLAIQNVMDERAVYSITLPCKNCLAVDVIGTLKELSGAPAFPSTKDSNVPLRQAVNEVVNIAMVKIPGKNYEIGKYLVTQKEWRDVMGSNPSNFIRCGENCPVENVSWDDVQEFIQKLNNMTGKHFRLPNEEEWDYACYGGSQTDYCGGNDINNVAWFGENSDNTSHPVGQKQANAFGLYDMSGNVWQWSEDSEYFLRVLRGGSWNNDAASLLATYRLEFIAPSSRDSSYGFRLARTLQ